MGENLQLSEPAGVDAPTPIDLALPHSADREAGADGDRNIVFTSLVKEDGDIIGLVAYSIYKQNKLDWLQAFEKARGRCPNEAEQTSYIIGESTPRRLAIYRYLADGTLSGNGPENALGKGAGEDVRKSYAAIIERGRSAVEAHGAGWIAKSLLTYAALVLAILVGVWLVVHYGQPAPRT